MQVHSLKESDKPNHYQPLSDCFTHSNQTFQLETPTPNKAHKDQKTTFSEIARPRAFRSSKGLRPLDRADATRIDPLFVRSPLSILYIRAAKHSVSNATAKRTHRDAMTDDCYVETWRWVAQRRTPGASSDRPSGPWAQRPKNYAKELISSKRCGPGVKGAPCRTRWTPRMSRNSKGSWRMRNAWSTTVWSTWNWEERPRARLSVVLR